MIPKSLYKRVGVFLKAHEPYAGLPMIELEHLVSRMTLVFYSPGEKIFEEGNVPQGNVFILNKGKVEVYQQQDGKSILIDICDVGDTFGVRSVMTGAAYTATAVVSEDTLVYKLPSDVFRDLLEKYAGISLFFAAGFAAGMPVVRSSDQSLGQIRTNVLGKETDWKFPQEEILDISQMRNALCCKTDTSLQQAAAMMASPKEGAMVIVDDADFPVGILTESDFTRRVVAGDIPVDTMVSAIMSTPVITVEAGISVGTAILTMIKHNIRHLVVTEDGTGQSPVIGIISEHDIVLVESKNPTILVKKLYRTGDRDMLRNIREQAHSLVDNYLKHEIPVSYTAEMITQINDVLISRAIEMAIRQLADAQIRVPDLKFCWLSLGSEGRGEQLLRTDQDNGLIYEDPEEGQEDLAKQYFHMLGQMVTDTLEYCGFAHCPGEIMASNPTWNQPVKMWKQYFHQWIQIPEQKALMHANIFFDFRATYGNLFLAQQLREYILAQIAESQRFINFFAKNACSNPPPLSFFRQFIVERDGEHKDKLDIKKRGMMPLADAARVLVYTYGEEGAGKTNTLKRYEFLGEQEPQNARFYQAAADAYEIFMRLRGVSGFQQGNAGRYIDVSELNKIDRKMLKYAFQVIKDVQDILIARFSLQYFY